MPLPLATLVAASPAPQQGNPGSTSCRQLVDRSEHTRGLPYAKQSGRFPRLSSPRSYKRRDCIQDSGGLGRPRPYVPNSKNTARRFGFCGTLRSSIPPFTAGHITYLSLIWNRYGCGCARPSAITFSTSSAFRASFSVISRWPSAVTSTSSSIRTPRFSSRM
jgi:hypothetical protein